MKQFYFFDPGYIPPPVIMVQNVSFRYGDNKVSCEIIYVLKSAYICCVETGNITLLFYSLKILYYSRGFIKISTLGWI